MKESQKVDYSELARLILEGYREFPEIFMESFCLNHDCFRDNNYTPDKQTINYVKTIFRQFLDKYDLSRDEMYLLVDGKSHACCPNPVRQLARRWLAKNCPTADRWKKQSPDIWRRNEVLIIDFSDFLVDFEVAECLFCESNGEQKVRLIRQFGNYFFPIVDQGDHSLSGNLNAAVPKVVVGPKYGDQYPVVSLDLNSVLHQKQTLEFLPASNKTILGNVRIFDGRTDYIGFYLWEPDSAGIYRAKFKMIAHVPRAKESGKKKIEVLSTLMEKTEVFSE